MNCVLLILFLNEFETIPAYKKRDSLLLIIIINCLKLLFSKINGWNFQNLNPKTPMEKPLTILMTCNIVMACCRLFDMWSYTQVCVYVHVNSYQYNTSSF